MRDPSRDQSGEVSHDASNVRRRSSPVEPLITQMSDVPVRGSRRAAATRVSSGDTENWRYPPAEPTDPRDLPARSNQTRLESPTVRYASTPFCEGENVARPVPAVNATRSAIGTGLPVT